VNDADLLVALGPTAATLVDRHLGTAKEWFPHEMVPWSRGRDFAEAEEFDPSDANLPEAARSALILNLLTEDNLPHYFRSIANRFGDDDPWGVWNRRWTAEEGRHSIVIRDYLTVTRSVDLRELERARMLQVSMGATPKPPSLADGLVYVSLQELATRIAHRNTGELLSDPAGKAIMRRVAADENLHHIFYRDVTSAALEVDPSGMVAAIERQVRGFEMPGAGIPNFKRHARLIASAGVYDFASYHDQILVPVIFTHWKIEKLQNLTAAAEQARDRLMRHIERVNLAAKRMSDRLASGRPAPAI
jgi:acyl-[acyl-carrier-protein] desaturase